MVKFSVFADLHHYPKVFFSDAENRLEKIKQRAVAEKVDFVIHCGDMLHRPSLEKEFLAKYKNFGIPTHHCIGNHECEDDIKNVLEAFELEKGYYYFDFKNYRFIVLDLNYMLIDGEAVHYTNGNFFGRPASAQLVTLPAEQKAWLKETVENSPFPCIIISHQSLEREHNGMSEKERNEILALLDELNGKSRKILLVINGHHHCDNLNIINGIPFLDMNSATYFWVDEPHDKYPKRLIEKYGLANYTLVYNEPLSAVITIDQKGITIKGAGSDYFMDIDPLAAERDEFDVDKRKITPSIRSAKIDFEK